MCIHHGGPTASYISIFILVVLPLAVILGLNYDHIHFLWVNFQFNQDPEFPLLRSSLDNYIWPVSILSYDIRACVYAQGSLLQFSSEEREFSLLLSKKCCMQSLNKHPKENVALGYTADENILHIPVKSLSF